MGSLTVGGRLPPLEHELVVSRQPAASAAAPQQPTAISSPYMHLSECFTGGHPPPPLQGMLPLFKKFLLQINKEVTPLPPSQGAQVPPPLAAAAPPLSRHSPDYQVHHQNCQVHPSQIFNSQLLPTPNIRPSSSFLIISEFTS